MTMHKPNTFLETPQNKHFFKMNYETLPRYTRWKYPDHLVSNRLRSSKRFIRKLLILDVPVEIAMGVCRHRAIHEDYSLNVLASAKDESFCRYENDTYRSIKHKMRRQLCEFDRFFKGILCGIHDSGSSLFVLNMGPDATIKQRIASFVNFPQGDELGWLFQAAVNKTLSYCFNKETYYQPQRYEFQRNGRRRIREV